MSKLLKLYEEILEFCNMKPDSKGALNLVFDDQTKPILIDGRRLVLPTEHNLKHYNAEKQVVFHPLQEYIDRGESDVVKRLRQQLNVRINYVAFSVMSSLFGIFASPAIHRDLTPEQRDLLLQIPKADASTKTNFIDFVVKNYAGHENRFFCNIYLKKSGTYRGTKHPRIGVVTFPFYEMVSNVETKIRKNDRENFAAMLSFVFQDSASDPEAFNAYSDKHDAPWLNALLRTSYNLASRLNELIDLYTEHIDDAASLKFNLSWIDAMEDLRPYRSDIMKIPSQRGNEGSLPSEEVAAPAASAPASVPVPVPAQAPAPAMYPTPLPPQYQVPGQPQYPAGMPVQPPPAPKSADGKISFREIEQVNPVVAATPPMVQTLPMNPWMVRPGMMQPGMMPGMMPYPGQVQAGRGVPALAPSPSLMYGNPAMGGYPGQYPGVYPGQYPAQYPGQYPAQAPAPYGAYPQSGAIYSV